MYSREKNNNLYSHLKVAEDNRTTWSKTPEQFLQIFLAPYLKTVLLPLAPSDQVEVGLPSSLKNTFDDFLFHLFFPRGIKASLCTIYWLFLALDSLSLNLLTSTPWQDYNLATQPPSPVNPKPQTPLSSCFGNTPTPTCSKTHHVATLLNFLQRVIHKHV